MKFTDVFNWPWKFEHGEGSFTIAAVVSVIPGVILWLLTFGAFRYFHLMDMYCNYTVEKELERRYGRE